VPGAAPWLRGLFAYNYSALPSLGLSGSALSGMKAAMPKLISGEWDNHMHMCYVMCNLVMLYVRAYVTSWNEGGNAQAHQR
jgi:hypothetical protein